jgi:3',5'-cyclic AMP phosphodiesterase CpdA
MPIHAIPISRRRFLAGSAALLAGAQFGRRSLADDGTSNKWALLADIHLIHPSTMSAIAPSIKTTVPKAKLAELQEHVRLTRQRLSRVTDEIKSLKQRPVAAILNGDSVEFGTQADYKLLLTQIDKLLRANMPVHFTLGNHDHRTNFINSGAELRQSSLVHERYVSLLETERANWVLLDSLKMREADTSDRQKPWSHIQGPGLLGKEQLEWLTQTLDRNSTKPALIVAHHNIEASKEFYVRSGDKVVDVVAPIKGRMHMKGVEDTDAFLQILFARKHVKAVFCGHQHQFQIRKWRDIYFVYLPAVGYPFNPQDAVGWLECDLLDQGIRIKAHTLDRRHPHSGKTVDLTWA